MKFIPANESRPVIWFFERYTEWLLRRRFKQVWVKQKYTPGPTSKTVYFLNHNMWWDGLLPLYLNRHFFHQNARALMEDKQMKQHPFFSKIGAFSINLEDPRSALRSLRYAVESMQRDQACLFIYPEGKITPVSGQKPEFKKGLAWLYQQLPDIDFVPIGIYPHFMRNDKPELYFSIGNRIELDNSLSKSELSYLLEECIREVLSEIRNTAGFDDQGYIPQF